MSANAQLPSHLRLVGPGPLLAAFQSSLTAYGFPSTGNVPPLTMDAVVCGSGIGPAAAVAVTIGIGPGPGAEVGPGAEGGGPVEDAAQPDAAQPGAAPGGAADPVAAGGRAPDEGFAPPDDEFCWTWPPDPDTGCPADLAGLTEEQLQARTTSPPLTPTPWPDGIVPPDGFPNPVPLTVGGPGFGFGQGDPLDTAPPGPGLAGLAEDASMVLAGIDDDCLTGIIRAWHRVSSWATGRELAAIAELARRRPTEGLPGSGREYVADELAAALTLTCRSAQGHRDLAWQLANVLPATLAALCAGQIDLAKARVIANGTAELTAAHAAAVEAAVLPRAPGQTTGQLRAAVAKAVLTADPAAATRQREAAQAHAHVSCWTGQAGTAHLEGHDLPPAQTLAADARLGQIATAWKAQGAQGGMDLLRAHAYLALLLGHDTTAPPANLLLAPGDPATSRTHLADTGTGTGGGSPAPTFTAGTSGGPGATGNGNSASSRATTGTGGGAVVNGSSVPNRATTGTGRGAVVNGSSVPNRATTGTGGGAVICGSSAPRGAATGTGGGAAGMGGQPQVPAGLRARAPGPDPQPAPEPGYGLPPIAAMINLTVPLATLLHLSDRPGEAAGYGPIAPGTARLLAGAAAGHPATRWRLIVTSPDGHATATGDARGHPIPAEGWTVTVRPIAAGDCDHHNQEPGYRPSPALARLIRTRTTTCCFPGCRRPARRCDLDHTIPYEDGGRTCECDLAPLCRRHHQVKQADGWIVQQPRPGVLVWLTPGGRRYTILPSQHPT
jgi:hypothetical protein